MVWTMKYLVAPLVVWLGLMVLTFLWSSPESGILHFRHDFGGAPDWGIESGLQRISGGE